ncbi:hypothetical protein RRG08_013615 [Elysia crispata]|uniref:Uncharacterized protein n=1 Tax=Elysia crispata TaxID=231223 RepID=A0AAE1E1M2_9GAST|nr:hypothetical protein RRG08_013615 [Elysia crispata]
MNPNEANCLYHQVYTLLWFMGPGFTVYTLLLFTGPDFTQMKHKDFTMTVIGIWRFPRQYRHCLSLVPSFLALHQTSHGAPLRSTIDIILSSRPSNSPVLCITCAYTVSGQRARSIEYRGAAKFLGAKT